MTILTSRRFYSALYKTAKPRLELLMGALFIIIMGISLCTPLIFVWNTRKEHNRAENLLVCLVISLVNVLVSILLCAALYSMIPLYISITVIILSMLVSALVALISNVYLPFIEDLRRNLED